MPIEVTAADVDQARSGTPVDPVGVALADYVSLTDVALRRRAEPERGVYIAESEKVIRRALAAGHRPRSLLMARRWLVDLADVVAQAEADRVPVLVGDHEVLEALTAAQLGEPVSGSRAPRTSG